MSIMWEYLKYITTLKIKSNYDKNTCTTFVGKPMEKTEFRSQCHILGWVLKNLAFLEKCYGAAPSWKPLCYKYWASLICKTIADKASIPLEEARTALLNRYQHIKGRSYRWQAKSTSVNGLVDFKNRLMTLKESGASASSGVLAQESLETVRG